MMLKLSPTICDEPATSLLSAYTLPASANGPRVSTTQYTPMRLSSDLGSRTHQMSLKTPSMVLSSMSTVTTSVAVPTRVSWAAFSENCKA